MSARLSSFLCCCMTAAALIVPAQAVDSYSFTTTNPDEFYQTGVTSVTYDGQIPGSVQGLYDFTPQTVYTSEWGATVITPELDEGYGLSSQKPANAPGFSGVTTQTATPSGGYGLDSNSSATLYPEISASQATNSYALTPVEDVRQADGSIGTLKIPSIGLTAIVYDGEMSAAMKKGAGHIESTSAWNSNVGIAAHNRGASTTFGKLKNLNIGDEITYSTTLGTRTYVVATVQKIAANDWSYLQYTSDNRLTLITCVENQPQYRLCVQAIAQ